MSGFRIGKNCHGDISLISENIRTHIAEFITKYIFTRSPADQADLLAIHELFLQHGTSWNRYMVCEQHTDQHGVSRCYVFFDTYKVKPCSFNRHGDFEFVHLMKRVMDRNARKLEKLNNRPRPFCNDRHPYRRYHTHNKAYINVPRMTFTRLILTCHDGFHISAHQIRCLLSHTRQGTLSALRFVFDNINKEVAKQFNTESTWENIKHEVIHHQIMPFVFGFFDKQCLLHKYFYGCRRDILECIIKNM